MALMITAEIQSSDGETQKHKPKTPMAVTITAEIQSFDGETQKYKPETPMAVTITAFKDNTFEFTVKSSSMTWYLKKVAR
ncbi:hypothetical protein ACLB2K_020335 [Fragaria x ananassa]